MKAGRALIDLKEGVRFKKNSSASPWKRRKTIRNFFRNGRLRANLYFYVHFRWPFMF